MENTFLLLLHIVIVKSYRPGYELLWDLGLKFLFFFSRRQNCTALYSAVAGGQGDVQGCLGVYFVLLGSCFCHITC